jgi:hypothetical protein
MRRVNLARSLTAMQQESKECRHKVARLLLRARITRGKLAQTPVLQKERAWKRLQTHRHGFMSAQGACFLIL